MPRFKPRRQLRKGKRRKRQPEQRERAWLLRCLITKTGGLCEYCDRPCDKVEGSPRRMTIDHVVPVSRGGLTQIENLRLACIECNQEKGAGVSVEIFLEGPE